MKAIVLAAGKGIRMLPLTEYTPKPMIEVNGRPFLAFLLNEMKKAGIREKDIGIVVGYKKEKMEEFAKKIAPHATLIEQKDLLGTGHAVLAAKHFVGEENFLVINGDNFYDATDIEKFIIDDEFSYVAGFHHDEPQRYGVLVMDEDKLVRIMEKPKERIGDLINAGLYKFTPLIFPELAKIKKSERGEHELTDAITSIAEKGQAIVIEIDTWLDLGKIDDVEKIGAFLKDNY